MAASPVRPPNFRRRLPLIRLPVFRRALVCPLSRSSWLRWREMGSAAARSRCPKWRGGWARLSGWRGGRGQDEVWYEPAAAEDDKMGDQESCLMGISL